MEAQTARKRLKELRRLEEHRKREQLMIRHVLLFLIYYSSFLANRDESSRQCTQSRNQRIDKQMEQCDHSNFENEAALIEIELKKRHSNELEQFREQIEREHENAIVHYSGEILNLKKKSELLGSQGFYKEAKLLKKKVKQLRCDEKEKHQ